jgi:hypothetical protein
MLANFEQAGNSPTQQGTFANTQVLGSSTLRNPDNFCHRGCVSRESTAGLSPRKWFNAVFLSFGLLELGDALRFPSSQMSPALHLATIEDHLLLYGFVRPTRWVITFYRGRIVCLERNPTSLH